MNQVVSPTTWFFFRRAPSTDCAHETDHALAVVDNRTADLHHLGHHMSTTLFVCIVILVIVITIACMAFLAVAIDATIRMNDTTFTHECTRAHAREHSSSPQEHARKP